ncbi:hypothetical protein MNBD_GAMMA15-67 [hydrothermal vent metagenome]|uniref:TIR domain-containing protein n=1 Tax=hydrothermal vent metagenome TaxID=652676 RepID=A0A3B0YBA6_9ZZZZ
MNDSDTQSYRYSAFISYRHVDRDRKWAEWLVNALETYRIPKELQQVGFPARLGKVFRDKDELPSDGNLNSQIEDALKASRFLIVICSPDTPSSKWVSREIEIFKELGRTDKIFPLLVEGEPDESFPKVLTTSQLIGFDEAEANPPIKDLEPIGADVRPVEDKTAKETKKDELLRIVAGILGCAYDDLKQRDKLRERKKQRNRLLTVAASLIISIAGGLYYWDYNRIKTHYYKDYVTQWGVPKGLFPVGSQRQARRSATYAIETRRGVVESMRRINGSGELIPLMGDGRDAEPWLKGVAKWTYIVDGSGQAREVQLYGRVGKHIVTWDFDGPELVKFIKTAGKPFTLGKDISQLGGLGSASSSKSDISQYRLTLDEHGREIRITFENAYGMPVSDSGNNFGRVYQRYQNGRIKIIQNIGKSGGIQVSRKGVLATEYKYNASGDLTNVYWKNEKGKLHLNDKSYAFVKYVYGNGTARDQENVTEIMYFGVDEKPVLNKGGYAKATQVFDARGNLVQQGSFDIDGKPTLTKNGFAKLIQFFDSRGNLIERAYLGVDGEPTLHKDGITKFTQAFDLRGNIIERAYFGIDGNPILHKDGYAKAAWVFDRRGNIIEWTYFGMDGKLTLHKNGYAKAAQSFDAYGNSIERVLFGINGKPVLHKDGYAKFAQVYDARGNIIEQSYFGIDGESILNKNGFSKVTSVYDARGNLIEQAVFGIKGKPALHKDGYAKLTRVHDARGNIIEQAYFGIDGEPILNKNGFSKANHVYDARGNLIEKITFGVKGKPALHKNGYAKFTQVYNKRGNIIEQAYFGVDGKPILNKNGFSKVSHTFDARGNVVEEAAFGIDGKPALNKDGYSKSTHVLDARGNSIERAYFGTDGKPTLHKNGFAKITQVFDAGGNPIEQAFFGIDGEPILNIEGYARFTQIFDARGNKIEQVYFGIDGKPILHKDGYARVAQTINARGNLTETAVFGIDGKPVLHKENFAGFYQVFDARGNLTERSYFGLDGKPIQHINGFAKITQVYDAHGNSIDEASFGVDGNPTLNKSGYAKISRGLDARGNVAEEAYFGIDGKPVLNRSGFAGAKALRDVRGKLLEERYYGINGEPVDRRAEFSSNSEVSSIFGKWKSLVLNGIHNKETLDLLSENKLSVVKQEYDAYGSVISQRYFHADGSEAAGIDGFSEVSATYNQLRLPELMKAKLPGNASGLIKFRIAYTSRYNIGRVTFLDRNNQPLLSRLGFAEIGFSYDERDQLVKTQYFNEKGGILSEK